MSVIDKLKALDELVLAEPWELIDHPTMEEYLLIVTPEPSDIVLMLLKRDRDFAKWAVRVHNAQPEIVAVLGYAEHETGVEYCCPAHLVLDGTDEQGECLCGLDAALAALEAEFDEQ